MKASFRNKLFECGMHRVIAVILAISMILIPVRFPGTAAAVEPDDVVVPNYFADDFSSGKYINGITYKWNSNAFEETFEGGKYYIYSGPEKNTGAPVVGVEENRIYITAQMYDPVAKQVVDVAQSWRDYTVEADVTRIDPRNDSQYVGIMGRAFITDKGLCYYSLACMGDKIRLYKAYINAEGNWARTKIQESNAVKGVTGETVHLKLVFDGNNIRGFANDKELINYTDEGFYGAPLTSGSAGMYMYGRDWNGSFDNFLLTHDGNTTAFFDSFADDRYFKYVSYQWKTTETPVAQDVTYTWTETLESGNTSQLKNNEYVMNLGKTYSYNNYAILNGTSTEGVDVDKTWTNYTVEVDVKRENPTGTGDQVFLLGRLQENGSGYGLLLSGSGFSLWNFTEEGLGNRFKDTGSGLSTDLYDQWVHMKLTFKDNTVITTLSWTDADGNPKAKEYTYTDESFASGGVGLCVRQADGTAPLNVHFDNFKVTMEDGTVVYSDPFDSPITSPAQDATYTLTEEFGQNGANTATSVLAEGKYTINIPLDRSWNYVFLNGVTAEGLDVDQTWTDYTVEVDMRRNATSNQLRAGLVGRVTPVYLGNELKGYSFYRIKALDAETKVDKVYWDAGTDAFVTTADWRLYSCKVANNEWRKLQVTFLNDTVCVSVYDPEGNLVGSDSFKDESDPLLSGGVGLMTGYTTSNLSGSVDFDNLRVTMADGSQVFYDAFNSAPTMESVAVTYTLTEELLTAKGKDQNFYTPSTELLDGKYTISTENDRTSAYAWLNGTAIVDNTPVDADQTWTDYTVRVDVTRMTENAQHMAGILGRVTPVFEGSELKGYQYYEIRIHKDDVRIYKRYLDTGGTLKTSDRLARLYVGAAGQNTTTLEAAFVGSAIKINLYNAAGELLNSGKSDAERTFTDDGTYGSPLLSGGIALAMYAYSADAAWSVSFDNLKVTLADGTVAYTDGFDSVSPLDVTYQWTKDFTTHWDKTPIAEISDGVYKITTENDRTTAYTWLNGTAGDIDVDQSWSDYRVRVDISRTASSDQLGVGLLGRVTPVYDNGAFIGYTFYQFRVIKGQINIFKTYWDEATSTIKTTNRLARISVGSTPNEATWRTLEVVFSGSSVKFCLYDENGALLSHTMAEADRTFTDDGTYGAAFSSGGIALAMFPYSLSKADALVGWSCAFDNVQVTTLDGNTVFTDDFSGEKYFASGGAVREDSYYPAGGSYNTGFDAEGLTIENAYTPPVPAGDYGNAFDPEGLHITGGYAPAPSVEGCSNGFFEGGLKLENAYIPVLPEHWTVAEGLFVKTDDNAYPMVVSVMGGGVNYAGSWKNYGVEADFMITAEDADASLIFGYTASGYYELRMDGQKVFLYHSARPEPIAQADVALGVNLWHFARVELNGKKITGYVNGVAVVSYTADADICGSVGVKAIHGVRYDNFVAYPLSAGDLRRYGAFEFDVQSIDDLLHNWNFTKPEDWKTENELLKYIGSDAVGSINLKSKTFAANYYAELSAIPSGENDAVSLIGRASLDGKSYYRLTLDMQGGLRLSKSVSGVETQLAAFTKAELYSDFGIMLIPGRELQLRMEMFGSTIRCYLGGRRLFHLEDASVAAGVSGLSGTSGVAFRSLVTGVTYADPALSIVYADGTPVSDLTVFTGKVPDIKAMYLKVDIGDGNPRMILLDTVLDDSGFDENATGTVTVPVKYEGVGIDFVYRVVERTAEIAAINSDITALDMENLTQAVVDALSDRYNDLSAAEKAAISKENKDKLAAAQRAIDIQKYPELAGWEIVYKDEFDTPESAGAYTNAQIVTCTRNTGYWYVENGVMYQYFEDDYMRTNSLESGFALKEKNFVAKSVSVDVQFIDPDQWIGISVNFGPNGSGGYRFMISDKTTGYGGNRIRLYNNGALLEGVVEADESKWFKPGEWINLRMVFGDDGYIRCYVNDELYIEVQDKLTVRHDEYHSSGTVMLYSAEGWGRFDNLVVYGEELPYEEIPVINTDLDAGKYTDDFDDEAIGSDPSHWIELNTEDKWFVKADGDNKVYASKDHTADISETWLHVFETNVDYSAMLRVTDSGYYPSIALTARMNAAASYIRAGYDFALQKWFVKYRLAENFDEVAVYADERDEAVDFTDWVNVRLVLNGSALELYKDGIMVLTADVGTKVGPGRVGVYTARCNIEIDDVKLILTSGQGSVQDGVLEYYTSPMGITNTMGSYIEMPDGNILYYSDGKHAVSTDGGQTFTPTTDYSYFKTSTNIRLHNGDYVAIFVSTADNVNPTAITAYRSQDGGYTWTSSKLPTEAHSYAQPGGHVNEIKLSNGKYRLFFTAPINKGEDAGTYARTFYSDDNGDTWKESETRAEDWCNLGVFCETFISQVSKDVTMSSGKVIPAGTLVHYTSYNSSGTIRYSLSYDDGVTWEGDYALPEIVCPQGSCVFREDPGNPGTWYMLTLYSPQYQMYTARNRERVALFKSEDGLNWDFVCDVDRWGDNGDGGCGQLLHATNAYMTITEDYVFVNFGRNEEWQPGNNIVYGRIYRFDKDKLVAREIPKEYIIQDKSICYIEGTEQSIPLNSTTYANDVTFTVYYYDGTSDVISLMDAFATEINATELGTQTVIADYKHFRTIFTVNVVKGDAPAISGVVHSKTYCGAQTVTVTDANNDLASVTLNGQTVTLADGKFTVSAREGVQTIVATDKAGNVTTVKITVNAGHTGGTATCKAKAVCTVCGEAYGELAAHKGGTATCTDKAKCEVCGESYGEKNADKHTKDAKWATTADKHAKAYECCGKVVVAEEAHEWVSGKCEECGYEAALGTQQKPIEIPADKETVKEEAKVEAGAEQHYELDEALAGKTITVKGEGAYVIVDGKKYEAVNGVVEVKLPTKTGKISVVIGNAGTKAGTFSITVATPSDSADTGDNAAIALFGSLMALSILAAAVLLIPDIRKKLMK